MNYSDESFEENADDEHTQSDYVESITNEIASTKHGKESSESFSSLNESVASLDESDEHSGLFFVTK